MVLVVVAAVSASLVLGAAWGLFWRLPERVEGFIVALAGGALLLSLVLELIQPTIERTSLVTVVFGVSAGAVVFTVIDFLIDETWGGKGGGGLLAAVTLDGIPENLALGVALIGAGAKEVAALAAAIMLSNLPEAAAGAKSMRDDQAISAAATLGIWTACAALLSACALAGYHFLGSLGEETLGVVRCFAAGAVIASLATEVFPKAYKESRHLAGIATALGVLMALGLSQLGGG